MLALDLVSAVGNLCKETASLVEGFFSQITQPCLASFLYSFEITIALNLGCIRRQASTLEVSHLLQEYSERISSMRSPKFTYFLNHSHTLQPLKALNGTPEVTSR